MLTPKELLLGRTPADSPASKQGHLQVLSLNRCSRQAGFHENVATFSGELNDRMQSGGRRRGFAVLPLSLSGVGPGPVPRGPHRDCRGGTPNPGGASDGRKSETAAAF